MIAQNSLEENVPNPRHLSGCGPVAQWALSPASSVLGRALEAASVRSSMFPGGRDRDRSWVVEPPLLSSVLPVFLSARLWFFPLSVLVNLEAKDLRTDHLYEPHRDELHIPAWPPGWQQGDTSVSAFRSPCP